MIPLSTRLNAVKPSATMTMTGKAAELKARGVDVIAFTAGEPDFDTPPHILDAAVRALRDGHTRYTPVTGTAALRKAVAAQSAQIRGGNGDPSGVIISTGAKQVLYNFFMAVLSEGDEVVIPAPFWVSYPDQVRLAGGVPVILPTEARNQWAPTPEALDQVVTARTRVLVLNSPSNPSGAVYPQAAVEAITRCALDHNLWILCDEIYRDLVYGDARFSSALSCAGERRDRVFIVDGVSKTFAMTGFRIGWGIGHPDVISAMAVIQGQSTSCASSVAQEASLAAVEGPMDFLADWRRQYMERRDALVSGLNSIEGITCNSPDGAFYVLADVSRIVSRIPGSNATDVDLAEYLLDRVGVATVPGTPFGAPGYLRLSYAISAAEIADGLIRIADAISQL